MLRLNSLLLKLAALCVPARVRYYPVVLSVVVLLYWGLLLAPPSDFAPTWSQLAIGDLIAFYTGTKLWLAGASDQLYSFEAQHAFQRSFVSPKAPFIPYINPPHAVLLYLPFSLGPYWLCLLSWWAAGLAAFGASAALLRRAVPGLARWSWASLCLIIFCCPASTEWFIYAQASALIALIWTGCYVSLVRGQDLRAGLILALMAFKPQLALPMALPLIVARRWRALAGGALGLAGWLLLNLAIFSGPLRAWWAQLTLYREVLRAPLFPLWNVRSLYGLFNLLFASISTPLADALTAISSLALLALLIKLWWRAPWAPQSTAWIGRVAITLALAPLLSVQLYIYDLSLWFMPLLLVMGALAREDGERRRYLDQGLILGWSVVVYAVVFCEGWLLELYVDWARATGSPVVALQLTAPCVLAWSWVVYKRLVRGERGPEVTLPALPAG